MPNNEIEHNFNDQFSISTKTMTDEGFIQADAIMSKVGIASYKAGEFGDFKRFGVKSAEDTIRVFRSSETLFNDSTLKSFSNKPVTLGHPAGGVVNSKNAKKFSVGNIGDSVIQDGELMKARITITDDEAIQSMDSGKKFLSVGYQGKIIPEKGITDSGEEFDAKLIFMKGNHVALTDSPRAGIQCKVLDEKLQKGSKMSKIKINGIEVNINDDAAQAVQTLIDDNGEKSSKVEKLQEAIKSITDEKVKITASLDELKSKMESLNDEDSINEKVEARIKFIDSVKSLIPKVEFSGKSDREIKVAVIQSLNDGFDGEGKSDDYIDARMDSAIEYSKKAKKSGQSIEKKINDSAFSGTKKITALDLKRKSQEELYKRGAK